MNDESIYQNQWPGYSAANGWSSRLLLIEQTEFFFTVIFIFLLLFHFLLEKVLVLINIFTSSVSIFINYNSCLSWPFSLSSWFWALEIFIYIATQIKEFLIFCDTNKRSFCQPSFFQFLFLVSLSICLSYLYFGIVIL